MSEIILQGCMYKKKDGKLCNRAAMKGYNYCKQHTNILIKNHYNSTNLQINSPICKICNSICNQNNEHQRFYNQFTPLLQKNNEHQGFYKQNNKQLDRNKLISLISKYSPHSNHQLINEYTSDQLIIIINTISKYNPDILKELPIF